MSRNDKAPGTSPQGTRPPDGAAGGAQPDTGPLPPLWFRSMQAVILVIALGIACWVVYREGPIYAAVQGVLAHVGFDTPVGVWFAVAVIAALPLRIVYLIVARAVVHSKPDPPSDILVRALKSRYALAVVFLAGGVCAGAWFGVRVLSAGSLEKVSLAGLRRDPPHWGKYVEVRGLLDWTHDTKHLNMADLTDDYVPMVAPGSRGPAPLVVDASERLRDQLRETVRMQSAAGMGHAVSVKGILSHRLPARVRNRLAGVGDDPWVLDASESPDDLLHLGATITVALLVCGIITLVVQRFR